MRTKEVDLGRITGLSSYELAVKHGFVGTEEDFLNKENAVYEYMRKCIDDGTTELRRIVASVTDKQTEVDLSEVIESRGNHDSLGERLVSNENVISEILNRLETLDSGGQIIEGATIDDDGNLVVKVKDGYDESVYGNLELRKRGAQIQWRSTGFKDWQSLVYLKELMPKFTEFIVNALEPEEEASVEFSGTGDEYSVVFNIPRGKDGMNGGQILDAKVNEKGELILTVANNDWVVAESDNLMTGIPMLSAGDIKLLEPNEEARFTITGTPVNPVLNLYIPRLHMPTIGKAYVAEDGLLKFEYVQEV